MDLTFKIGSAGNMLNPCLFVLKSRGCQLRAEEHDSGMLWFASQDGGEFVADSPIELLGLVVAREELGDRPWECRLPNVLDEILGRD